MDTIDILSKEFFTQDFAEEQPYSELLGKYKDIARNYARMESAVAVLSDMRTNMSYIYYGSFSRMLEIDKCGDEGKVSSIWEKEIFKLIHPDDLAGKHLQELCFFHFVKHQPKSKRTDYYLISKLRMKNGKIINYIQHCIGCSMFLPLLTTRCGWLYAFIALYCLIFQPNA